ncbi:MAG: hypothetical protein IJM54_09845 [Thermoguttaceae bacterium]|nr:hypothetical protein [Thermoguttaceae bacterium]
MYRVVMVITRTAFYALGAVGSLALGALLGCFYAVGAADLCRNADCAEWVAAVEADSERSETAVVGAAAPDDAVVRIERAVYVADEPVYAPTSESVAEPVEPIKVDSAMVVDDAANGWEPAVDADAALDLIDEAVDADAAIESDSATEDALVVETNGWESAVVEENVDSDESLDMDSLFDESVVTDESDAVEEDADVEDESVDMDAVFEEDVEVGSDDDSLDDLINIEPVAEETADVETDADELDVLELESDDDDSLDDLINIEPDEEDENDEVELEVAESDATLDEESEEPAVDESEENVGDVESIVEDDAAVEIEAAQDVEVAIETGDDVAEEEIVDEAVEESANEIAEEAAEEPIDEVVEEAAEETVDEVVEETVEETVEEIVEETTEEVAEETVEEPVDEVVEDVVEEVDSEWQEVVSTEWQSGDPAAQNAAPQQEVAAAQNASAAVEALEDQMWIVMSNGSQFFCQVLENNAWRPASIDEFYAGDSANRSTIVWAHGFQTDISDATSDAFAFRSTLDRARAMFDVKRACRLVVWKWASERATLRIAPDARMKMQLADYEGGRLAKFVGGIDDSNNVSFVGFSFGARVVGSALQAMATTPSRYMSDARTGKISLTLVSAACDYGAFDYGAYAQGSKLVSCVLNVYNPSDYALRYYPFVSETRSSALGSSPICGRGFVNAEGRLYNMSSQSVMGREHSFCDVIKCVPRELLLESLL